MASSSRDNVTRDAGKAEKRIFDQFRISGRQANKRCPRFRSRADRRDDFKFHRGFIASRLSVFSPCAGYISHYRRYSLSIPDKNISIYSVRISSSGFAYRDTRPSCKKSCISRVSVIIRKARDISYSLLLHFILYAQ